MSSLTPKTSTGPSDMNVLNPKESSGPTPTSEGIQNAEDSLYRGKKFKDMTRHELYHALIVMGKLYHQAVEERLNIFKEKIEDIKFWPKGLSDAEVTQRYKDTSQGTTEESVREEWQKLVDSGYINTLSDAADFWAEKLESETSLSYQRGQDDLRERMREEIRLSKKRDEKWTEVLILAESHNRGYNAALKDMDIFLLKAKESKENVYKCLVCGKLSIATSPTVYKNCPCGGELEESNQK